MSDSRRARPFKKGLLEDDCLHLLWCVANRSEDQPQTYESLSATTGIPTKTLWNMVNTYKEVLMKVAYKYNYRVRVVNGEDAIISVVYDGPIRSER